MKEVKKMKIIMIDQDGVALNQKYQLTADLSEMSKEIKKNTDIILVPNSNTPAKRLAKNFELIFGFRPKIVIAEKGAVVQIGKKKIFATKINGIRKYTRKLIEIFKNEGSLVAAGDSATWIRRRKRFVPNKKAFIVDAFREQSVGFYLKKTDKLGNVFTDKNWAETGIQIVKNIKLPVNLESFVYNPSYGIAISNAKGISKQNGLQIIRKFYPNAQFYMIGDSDDDYLGKNITHCAVSNASKNYKKKSKFIARNPYTLGMNECLRWILRQ